MYKEQLESAHCAGEHQADSVYLGTYYSASLHPCLPTTPPNLEDHYSMFIWASWQPHMRKKHLILYSVSKLLHLAECSIQYHPYFYMWCDIILYYAWIIFQCVDTMESLFKHWWNINIKIFLLAHLSLSWNFTAENLLWPFDLRTSGSFTKCHASCSLTFTCYYYH